MAVTSRFFSEVTVGTEGIEIPNLLGGVPDVDSGYLEQVIIRASAGGGSSIRVEIRYDLGDSSRENLVYLFEDGALPFFIDSCIKAPFDLKGPNTATDMHLFFQPEAAGVFEIRLDFDIDRWRQTI
jgi:hypothetical protein